MGRAGRRYAFRSRREGRRYSMFPPMASSESSGWAHFARMPRRGSAAAEMTGEKSRDSIPIYSIARRARSSALVNLINVCRPT